MKTLLIIMILCTAAQAIDYDKKLHLGVSTSLGITTGATLFECKPEWSSGQRILVASSAALVPGIGKELIDDYFDFEDLAYDAVGALVGATLSELIGSAVFVKTRETQVVIGYQGEWK